MSEDDRPFVCTSPNCSQRFTTEDHLTVHMKKHDMTLALAAEAHTSHSLFLDQTPTPTKFLRNLEELGLFQELSKNPFDEAFKKASDNPTDEAPIPGPDKLETPTLQLSPHPTHTYTRTPSKLAIDSTPTKSTHLQVPSVNKQPGTTTNVQKLTTTSTQKQTTTNSKLGLHVPFSKLASNAQTAALHSQATNIVQNKPTIPNISQSTTNTLNLTKCPSNNPTKIPTNIQNTTLSTDKQKIVLDLRSLPTTSQGMSSVTPQSRPTSHQQKITPSPRKMAETRPISKLALEGGIEVVKKMRLQQQFGDVTSTATRIVPQAPIQRLDLTANQPTSTTPDEETEVLYITSRDAADSTTPSATENRATPVELGVTSSTTSPVPQRITPAPPVAIMRAAAPPQITLPVQILLQLPTGRTVPLNVPAPTPLTHTPAPAVPVTMFKAMAPTVTTSSTMPQSLTKQKLKAVLQNAQKHHPLPPDDSDSDDESVTSDIYQQKSPDYRGGGDHTEDRRKRFLERNRAAAARCRNKRKMWITNLERKADELQNTNQKLQNEVTTLRTEVSELKLLLMAHKDCPITLQQKSQGQIPFSNLMSDTPTTKPRTSTNLTSEEVIASDALTKMAEGTSVHPQQSVTITENLFTSASPQITFGSSELGEFPVQLVMTENSELVLQQPGLSGLTGISGLPVQLGKSTAADNSTSQNSTESHFILNQSTVNSLLHTTSSDINTSTNSSPTIQTSHGNIVLTPDILAGLQSIRRDGTTGQILVVNQFGNVTFSQEPSSVSFDNDAQNSNLIPDFNQLDPQIQESDVPDSDHSLVHIESTNIDSDTEFSPTDDSFNVFRVSDNSRVDLTMDCDEMGTSAERVSPDSVVPEYK